MALNPMAPDAIAQRRAVFRLIIVAGVILVMSMSGKKAKERAAAKAKAQEVPEVAAPRPPGPAKTWEPGARTQVPRPLATRTGSELPVTAPLTPTGAGPADTADADAELRQALSASLEAVVPEVRDCLHQWWMMDPNLAGEVELEFKLGADGLGDVEILDHSAVPVGPLSCFATALYDADWPRLASEITVVQPFRFEN